MAEYDLVIRGGMIVDGTGVPRYEAELAAKDGRVAMISGKIKGRGTKELDATGCIVAPGAIDLHTHYDAQLNWDPYASLDGWFGVTTVSIGQCGFGFAPTRPEDRDLNMRMMNRIEAIPLESMKLGMRWDWETYPEYLDSLDRQGLGLNVASLFPFSPLRGYVLGMLPARERRSVTDAELNRMKELFHEGMKAGAFGFAADRNEEDRCEDGAPIPSHVASAEEYFALAEILGEFEVGWMGWTIGISDNPEGQQAFLKELMKRSGRPLHVLLGSPGGDEWLKTCRDEGLPVVAQKPSTFPEPRFKLSEYNLFDYMPSWVQPLVGTAQERAAKLRDPAARAAMKKDAEKQINNRTNWRVTKVLEVVHERNYKYEGLTIQEVADMMGKHPVDAFVDLALDEDLETEFSARELSAEAERTLDRGIKNPYTHISSSDGGAHTRFQSNSTWPVHFLSYWIRDRELMTPEQAHYKISVLPAWIGGYKGRGMLRMGAFADIMIYNPAELGLLYERPIYANDFPGGERRIIQKPKGLRYIIVNGTVTFEENDCTGALPGKLLRSYEMVD